MSISWIDNYVLNLYFDLTTEEPVTADEISTATLTKIMNELISDADEDHKEYLKTLPREDQIAEVLHDYVITKVKEKGTNQQVYLCRTSDNSILVVR